MHTRPLRSFADGSIPIPNNIRFTKALKTFGRNIKTIFILRCIDDVELRRAIEKQQQIGGQ